MEKDEIQLMKEYNDKLDEYMPRLLNELIKNKIVKTFLDMDDGRIYLSYNGRPVDVSSNFKEIFD